MTIRIGNKTALTKIALGNQPVSKIYFGTIQVWSSGDGGSTGGSGGALSRVLAVATGATTAALYMEISGHGGTLYIYIAPAVNSSPSVSRLQSGDGSAWSSNSTVQNMPAQHNGPSGLVPNTNYKAYFMYAGGGVNSPIVEVPFATKSTDTSAPVLSKAVGETLSTSTLAASVVTNEPSGMLYWVLTTSSSRPSATQVKNGQNERGASAVRSAFQAVSDPGEQDIFKNIPDVDTATYYVHFMQTDATGNQSSVVSTSAVNLAVQTSAQEAPVETVVEESVPSDTGDTSSEPDPVDTNTEPDPADTSTPSDSTTVAASAFYSIWNNGSHLPASHTRNGTWLSNQDDGLGGTSATTWQAASLGSFQAIWNTPNFSWQAAIVKVTIEYKLVNAERALWIRMRPGNLQTSAVLSLDVVNNVVGSKHAWMKGGGYDPSVASVGGGWYQFTGYLNLSTHTDLSGLLSFNITNAENNHLVKNDTLPTSPSVGNQISIRKLSLAAV